MENRQSESFWKVIAISLMGVVVTGASAWMVLDQGIVNRDEISLMISRESPYAAERQMVTETLKTNSELLNRVAADVNSIKVEQARLSERVEMLIRKGDKQ